MTMIATLVLRTVYVTVSLMTMLATLVLRTVYVTVSFNDHDRHTSFANCVCHSEF